MQHVSDIKKLKHIGIVGVSSEGAALCYRTICAEAGGRLGAHVHPEITLHNFNFAEILAAQNQEDWDELVALLVNSVKKLALVGADFAIIPANSVHIVFDEVARGSPIPLLNTIKVGAEECKRRGFRKVGVLGVGLTMERQLYREPLRIHSIEAVAPDKESQREISKIIYQEIVPARTNDQTTPRIINVIEQLRIAGCDAVILGCTELPLIINESNSPLPFVDSTRTLALRALEYALI